MEARRTAEEGHFGEGGIEVVAVGIGIGVAADGAVHIACPGLAIGIVDISFPPPAVSRTCCWSIDVVGSDE